MMQHMLTPTVAEQANLEIKSGFYITPPSRCRQNKYFVDEINCSFRRLKSYSQLKLKSKFENNMPTLPSAAQFLLK